ncbi:hypothetical protein BRYFOR_05480 [Marvinbryantia formatexigens DSM 14469]|uniref:Antitoxin n=2 Tax=Marvinbryantia TaxID=248744 RepID=C6LA38_9FIRM|nr:hypothetical protein BRYFOR_05480 [Marvinbryantia formatexigens DSM 14469]
MVPDTLHLKYLRCWMNRPAPNIYAFIILNMEKGVVCMLVVKCVDVRDNFENLCDKVFNGETLVISRPKNENVVMLSEREYNEMIKARRNEDYLSVLDKSMTEVEEGDSSQSPIL